MIYPELQYQESAVPRARWSRRWALFGQRCTALAMLAALTVMTGWAHAAPVDDWAAFRALRGVAVPMGNDRYSMREVTGLAQDMQGDVWVSAYGHFARIEGAHTRFYATESIPALGKLALARTILPLAGGDVLLGFGRGGVLRWEREQDRFLQLAIADGTRLTRINQLQPSRSGGVWISAEQGLFHWSGRTADHAERVLISGPGESESTRVFAAFEQADGALWVAVHRGVRVRAAGQATFTPLLTGSTELDARVAAETVWTMAGDDRGRTWLGMVRSGVVVVDPQRGSFAPAGVDGVDGIHGGRTIRTLLWHDGRMWLGSEGEGLLGCEGECRSVRKVPVNLSVHEGRRNFYILNLMADTTGRLWATSERGAFHFNPSPLGMTELDATPPGMDPRQQHNPAHSLLVDSRQRLWMGMPAGEIQVLDPHDGSRRLIRLPDAAAGDAVWSMHEDGQGRVWAASRGVAWVDMDSLQARVAGEAGRRLNQRFSVVTGANGRVWLGSHDGVVEMDSDGQVLRQLRGTGASGLKSSQVNTALYFDGAVWLGTALGLHRLDLTRWKAILVAPAGQVSGSDAVTPYVTTLKRQGDVLWIGSEAGVWKVAAGSTQPTVVVGTEDTDISSLEVDRDGTVWWVAGADQLVRMTASGKLESFGPHDGVHPGNGISRGRSAAAADGSVLFGTGMGAWAVSSQRFAAHPAVSPPMASRITKVEIDGRALPHSLLPAGDRQLTLPPGHDRISVEFSSVDYLTRDTQRYAYQLEGYDRRWVELAQDSLPVATYSRLPAGDYQLLLKVNRTDQPSAEWITRVPVHVQPYWYERNSVRAMALIGGCSLLLLWLWLRDRVAQRRRERLEALVKQRTQALEQANQQLEQLAGEDMLTGLYNRRRAFQRLAELREEARRHPRRDTLVLLDLDHFKQINDRHGHPAGDDVLREVGRRLKAALRGEDIAARYGGEEFLLVLVQTPLDDAVGAVGRVRDLLRGTPVVTEAGELSITASMGIAEALAEETVEQWIARADAALYRAKEQGRDRISIAPAQI